MRKTILIFSEIIKSQIHKKKNSEELFLLFSRNHIASLCKVGSTSSHTATYHVYSGPNTPL